MLDLAEQGFLIAKHVLGEFSRSTKQIARPFGWLDYFSTTIELRVDLGFTISQPLRRFAWRIPEQVLGCWRARLLGKQRNATGHFLPDRIGDRHRYHILIGELFAVAVLVRSNGPRFDWRNLPAPHLLKQGIKRVRDNAIIERTHAFAADLQVRAAQRHTPAAALPFAVDDPLSYILADVVLQLGGRECLFGKIHTLPIFADNGHAIRVRPLAHIVDVVNLLAQVVPSRALLARDKRHLVVPAIHGHLDDALQGKRQPFVGLGHEWGGWQPVFFLPAICRSVLVIQQLHCAIVFCNVRLRLFARSKAMQRLPRFCIEHNNRVRYVGFCKALLLTGLAPIRLHFFHEQNPLAIGIGSVIDTDMGEDVGLVEVGRIKLPGVVLRWWSQFGSDSTIVYFHHRSFRGVTLFCNPLIGPHQ